MTKKKSTELEYREVVLSGIGRVMVPAHLNDTEILAALDEAENPKPVRKSQKAKG